MSGLVVGSPLCTWRVSKTGGRKCGDHRVQQCGLVRTRVDAVALEAFEVELRVRKQSCRVFVEMEERVGSMVEGTGLAFHEARHRAQFLEERSQSVQRCSGRVFHACPIPSSLFMFKLSTS
jgi:hypothetical protein